MEPYIGQIIMFAGSYAPDGWAFCDGQLLEVNKYTTLYSILGTRYGGDGRATFGLPDLRGRFPVHQGHGPGLSFYQLGNKGGQESVALNADQMPIHTHQAAGKVRAHSGAASKDTPVENVLAVTDGQEVFADVDADADMREGSVAVKVEEAGRSLSHTNVPPYQCVNFLIALEGEYPPRS